jgi:hypothetical protein
VAKTTTAASPLDELDDGEIETAMASGESAAGGWDGPCWDPRYHPDFHPDTKEAALVAKLAKRGAGSTWRKSLIGALRKGLAWGRPTYFLDVETPSGVHRVMLPEHKTLYGGLNHCTLGATVGVKLEGRGTAKPGQQAPWRFTVRSLSAPVLDAERGDALTVMTKEERELLQAASLNERAARMRALRRAAKEGGDDADEAVDDLPF